LRQDCGYKKNKGRSTVIRKRIEDLQQTINSQQQHALTSPKIENGVFEPNVVKEQALKSAAMILCVDDIITAKSPKGGPAGGMPGGMGGE